MAEMAAKLDQSLRETQELHSAKSRAQAETAVLSQKLEEAESQLSQLNKAKLILSRSLEEVKASMEDESRVRAELQEENRNLQAELEQLREQVSLIKACSSKMWGPHINFYAPQLYRQVLL